MYFRFLYIINFLSKRGAVIRIKLYDVSSRLYCMAGNTWSNNTFLAKQLNDTCTDCCGFIDVRSFPPWDPLRNTKCTFIVESAWDVESL